MEPLVPRLSVERSPLILRRQFLRLYVGTNGFVPRPHARENMRGHVIGMGGGGGDLGIGSRSNKSLLGQHRVVIAVDEIVSDPGMVRLLLKDRFQDFAAFPLVGESLVRFR